MKGRKWKYGVLDTVEALTHQYIKHRTYIQYILALYILYVQLVPVIQYVHCSTQEGTLCLILMSPLCIISKVGYAGLYTHSSYSTGV